MTVYLVTWRIELDASSPEVAAELAREIQRDPTSTATVFEVREHDGGDPVLIDLLGGE